MIEDLVKLVAFGYMGLEVEKRMKEKNKEKEKDRNADIQKLKNMIIIVYDGKAPYVAALNIAKYIHALEPGYQIAVADSEKYCRECHELINKLGGSYPKRIVIGHHEFAKNQLERVDLSYDNHGLKIGMKNGLYVLNASRSDLGFGQKGREAFAAYYDQEISKFDRDVLEKYEVPMTFGLRDETRKSQYDLLWLKFIPDLDCMLFAYDLERRLEIVGTTSDGTEIMRLRNPSHE